MMYIGTYTGKGSKGIYSFEQDPFSGEIREGKLAVEIENPSYMIPSRDGKRIFAVSEMGELQGASAGDLYALERNEKDGSLVVMAKESTFGKDPCHLCFDESNKDIYIANYSEGSISRIHIKEAENRSKSELQFKEQKYHKGNSVRMDRQEQAHVHFVTLDVRTGYLWAVDLGMDSVFLYDLNSSVGGEKKLSEPIIQFELPSGYGPRHLLFHPKKEIVYCVQELVSKVVVIKIKDGIPEKIIQEVSLSEENVLYTAAAIKCNREGTVLYATNRGANTITAFAIKEDGTLQIIGTYDSGGRNPRDTEISPEGNYLYCANQDSDLITVYAINPKGELLRIQEMDQNISMPVCICFV